jgi:hypothetical protein
VVVKAETVTTMTDKATGRKYLNLTFPLRGVATAWVEDIDYDVMRSGFAAYHTKDSADRNLVGDPAIDEDAISPKCAKDWPDDFVMRDYCEKRQHEAVAKIRARSMTSNDERTIRTKCGRDWPDDFVMRDYCEVQQLKAIRQ